MNKVLFNDTGWYSCRVVNEHMDEETECGYLDVVAEESKGSRLMFEMSSQSYVDKMDDHDR